MTDLPRLLVLTDRAQLRLGRALVRTVRECVGAGLEAVVVREHDLDPVARHALVAELATVPGLLVVSSRIPDPAADLVHLAAGQAAFGGPAGRSCHTAAEVARAAGEGAAYATLSPYAASTSKPGYGPLLDPSDLAGHPINVFALGGIDASNAAEAISHGAYGVAVMGAVMRAADPASTVTELLAELTP
ncbi:thiamine phosphate synthase [Nocardioides sp. InS609-2]|uniref:thiamine phosphate synthase n=1 Tax=Nocardioides sp. InS609-2 TaxID=2760705 RepID=UPI0020C0F822|nr:thiamine phosphate synthase [Nocardioides sp. InS609-2]